MSKWIYANEVLTIKWRSAMTIPRELKLSKEENNCILKFEPIGELRNFKVKSELIKLQAINKNIVIADYPEKNVYNLELSFFKHEKMEVSVKFSNDVWNFLLVGFSSEENRCFIDRTNAGKSNFSNQFANKHFANLDYNRGTVDMNIFLDHSSVELFADEGRKVMTDMFFPKKPYTKIEIISRQNKVKLIKGSISEFERIWR